MTERGGTSIPGFLAAVRARIYRGEAARAMLLAIAALSGIAVTLPIAAQFSGDSRVAAAVVRVVGVALTSVVVLVAIGNGVIGPRRRFSVDNALARWVGKRHPAIASDLLSAVELPASLSTPWAPSGALVSALSAATASRLDAISLQSLYSPNSVSRAKRWALGGIAANIALLAVAPGTMLGGWRQVASWPTQPFDGAELSGVPLVGDLEVTLTAPTYAKRGPTTFASTSGDVRGLPGTKVAFKGRILVPATAAEILIDNPGFAPRRGFPSVTGVRNTPGQGVRRSIDTPGFAGVRSTPDQGVRRSIDTPGFAGVRSTPDQGVRRSIDNPGFAGVRSTPDQGVRRSIDNPGFAGVRSTPDQGVRRSIDNPGFAGVRSTPDQGVRRSIDNPLTGSAVTVENPRRGAHTGEGAVEAIAARIDDAGYVTAELTIERSARYRFATTSPAGRSVETMTRSIDAEVDLAPTVQLTAPNDPLEIANVKTVEIGYSIDDDFAVTSAELVWEASANAGRQGDRGRKPLPAGSTAEGVPRIQGKLIWDLAEINVASGGEVRYWIEAKDNDSISGPNIGKSRIGHLRVVSPRARHEEALARQEQVAEKLLANLGQRLAGPDDAAREELAHQLRDAIAELRSVAAAFEKDPQASEGMRKTLGAMSERIERVATIEQRWIQSASAKDTLHALPKGHKSSAPRSTAFAAIDAKLIAELEDDTLTLADWLDRERVESLLDIADEANARHKRLANLLAQFSRTKEPRLTGEIEREMRALERAYGELAKHRDNMPEDVLDQYIHRDAVKAEAGTSCIAEVATLIRAKKTTAAQTKLDACQQQQQRSIASLEGSLARVRGDKFSDEQGKLDEVMNALADIAKDQDDLAGESGRLYDSYADKANETAREHRREASAKFATFIDKTRKRIDAIDETGLTPFAMEELDIVVRRITDLEHMVNDGDLAEALMMARQARASLDTIAAELASALDDDPRSKWLQATQHALDGIEKTRPILKDLVAELTALSPRPEQIMSSDEQRTLDRLRRRQAANEQRAKRLGERVKQLGGELPGDAAGELGKKLAAATDHMTKASDRMKAKDPSGARESTRAAADELAKARDKARSAARQAQHNAIDDEPIRIPGAEEHRTSERFREDLLEAMKHKSDKAPEGYDVMIKRYYQDLAK